MLARFVASTRRGAGRLVASPRAPLVVLGLIVVAQAVLVGRIAVTNHYVFNDEGAAVFFGRVIEADLSQIGSNYLSRGPERMVSLIAAVVIRLVDETWRQVAVLHAIAATSQALVAIPVWASARLLGLGRWQALLPAAIACSGPFAMFGVFTMNISVGLLWATVTFWAVTRSFVRPGAWSDIAILGGVGLTALARVGWAPLVLALAPATLAILWFSRTPGTPLRAWARALPRAAYGRHPVLLPLALLAGAYVLVAGSSGLMGGSRYGFDRLGVDIAASVVVDNTHLVLAHLALACAIVPLAILLPGMARDLVRPRVPEHAGLAWLLLTGFAIFSYVYYGSVNEDRYLVVLLPPVVVAAAVMLFRSPPPAWAVVLGGLIAVRLVATAPLPPAAGPIDYFLAPTSLFFERTVVGEASLHLGALADHTRTIALVAAVAVAALVVVATRSVRLRRMPAVTAALAAVVLGLVGFQAAAATNTANRFVDGLGNPAATGPELAFIDRQVGSGRTEPVILDGTWNPMLRSELLGLQIWNRTLGPGLPASRSAEPAEGAGEAAVNVDTGEVLLRDPPPTALLTAGGFAPFGFAGEHLPVPPVYAWARLLRLDPELRLAWGIRGDAVEGHPAGGRPLRLRVFPARRPTTCVTALVRAHPQVDRAVAFRLDGGRPVVAGNLAPGAVQAFEVSVPARRRTDLVLTGTAARLPDGTSIGPSLLDVTVAPCAA